ncbi:MAG: amidohydrolase [Bacteroidales bacterium]|nr:amidohydrolase [Bacteroidales bacterium]
MKYTFTLFILITLIAMSTFQTKTKADLIVYNAKVYTVDSDFSVVTAFAVKDGKVLTTGSDKAILDQYEAPEQINEQGRAVYPGFNDGHSHFLSYGMSLIRWADLVGTQSFEEVLDKVKAHHDQLKSFWILGRGWDQNDWKNTDYPDNTLLNRLYPNNPVVLTRIDGHAVLANAKALELAGITPQTKIEGGEIVLDHGKLTGVLIDNALDIVQMVIPEATQEEKTKALLEAQRNCFAEGLTTVTDAGLDKADILLLDRLQKEGKLDIRIYAMMSPTQENFDEFFTTGPVHNGRLTVSAVKLYIDGALGSRGALLLKPYSDMPGHFGLRLHPMDYYDSICAKAYKAGFQVNTHAIGDSGNRIMLQTYARFLKGKNDRRWRIEHAQVLSPEDFHYFGDYSVIPSIQSTHCTSDMYWAEKRLGPVRIKTAYAYKQLMEENGWEVNGTDFPIEDISPLKTFYAAVARKDIKGWPSGGFEMENALSRRDALYSVTLWPAKGSFDEKQKGSLEPGKVADFVVLDQDIMNCPEATIPHVKVLSTYVSGKKVYSSR